MKYEARDAISNGPRTQEASPKVTEGWAAAGGEYNLWRVDKSKSSMCIVCNVVAQSWTDLGRAITPAELYRGASNAVRGSPCLLTDILDLSSYLIARRYVYYALSPANEQGPLKFEWFSVITNKRGCILGIRPLREIWSWQGQWPISFHGAHSFCAFVIQFAGNALLLHGGGGNSRRGWVIWSFLIWNIWCAVLSEMADWIARNSRSQWNVLGEVFRIILFGERIACLNCRGKGLDFVLGSR